KLLDADPATSRERVSASDNDWHRLVEQRTRGELRQRDELTHQSDLDLVGAEGLRDGMRPPAADTDLDIGMHACKTGQGGRSDVEGEVGRESEREQTPAALASRFRFGDPTPHGLERSLGTWQEAAARRRQGHAAPPTNEQLRAELAF